MSFIGPTTSNMCIEHNIMRRQKRRPAPLSLKPLSAARAMRSPLVTPALTPAKPQQSYLSVPTFCSSTAPFSFNQTVKVKHAMLKSQLRSFIDNYWDSLPAVSQEVLYDLGYRNVSLESTADEQRNQCFPPPPPKSLHSRRLERTSSDLFTVWGWPSSGGLLTKIVDTVELEFLGLDKDTRSTPYLDQQKEDEFCLRLRKLGATWYAGEKEFRRSCVPDLGYDAVNSNSPRPRVLDPQLGWPSTGGVWMLDHERHSLTQHDLLLLHAAGSMDERCRTLEKLGATFFEDPSKCSHLAGFP